MKDFTSPIHGFISSRPAREWYESLIVGNGKMGAMAMSRPVRETIILNHERLFLPWHDPIPPVNTGAHLSEMREMMKAGKYQEAADFVVALSRKEGYDAKRWTDPYIPAFDLMMNAGPEGIIRGYVRRLDYETGEATVRWEDNRGEFRRRLFVSRKDNVVVVYMRGPEDGCFDCDVELAVHPVGEGDYWDGPGKFEKGIKHVEIGADREWLSYRSSYKRGPGGYEGLARVIPTGGEYKTQGSKIVLTDVKDLLILIGIKPLDRFEDSDLASMRDDLGKIFGSYGDLLDRHTSIHREIFNRVSLDLGGGEDRNLTAEELKGKSGLGNVSPALLEKVFDSGRYAILSSCGELPPHLQGVWTGTWGAPWSGDYTQNGNLQTAIASLLSGNMAECMESYLGYIESLVPASRDNAKYLYGCRGTLLASRTSTHGLNNHFDRTWPMTFWTVGQAWAAHFFYDYWLYTGDREFLEKRALPFMEEAALFFEDFLIEDENGKYLFSPSYSPENDSPSIHSQACVNATMDIAAVKELLTNLITVCTDLRVKQDKVDLWKTMLSKLPEYMINEDGAVKEWTHPDLKDNYAHRHSSHLYPLFEWFDPEIGENPELREAFARALELRLKEQPEGGGVMAFGLVQLGLAAAALKESETAFRIVDWLVNGFYFDNLASSHDKRSLFNTDISGGLPALVIKMLVDSRPGIIEVLPAFPKSIPSGTIQGIPCRGQVLIESLSWDRNIIKIVLRSKKKQSVTLKAPGRIVSITGKADMSILKSSDSPDACEIDFHPDEGVSLNMKVVR